MRHVKKWETVTHIQEKKQKPGIKLYTIQFYLLEICR